MSYIKDWHGKDFKIAIASDHGGFELKNRFISDFKTEKIYFEDYGPSRLDPEDDYPDFAGKLAFDISKGKLDCGVLICRSGVGMSVNANRFHNVRSVVAYEEKTAKASRDHNCTNILILSGDCTDYGKAKEILKAWLATPFSNSSRHIRRLEKIEMNSYDEISPIRHSDPEIADMLDSEKKRQDEGIELIASENFASCAVRSAQGSVLTNKYAEGYPGKRYYNGCEFVDEVESAAIERACKLFGAESANVQAHSGSQANMAAYFALINPGDTVLAMDLAHGGHLTHGHPMNFSGMLYKIIPYGVDRATEMLDYPEIARLAEQNKPKLIMVGASAYPRTIDFKIFKQIADSVNAKLVVDMAHIAGLVAAGEHPSPVPLADVVTSTTHKTLRGPRSGLILCKEEHIKAINSKVFPGLQGGPMMHTIAAKAICFREAMSGEFKEYQKQTRRNAAKLAEELVKLGFRIVSGGTDNHLMLVDLRPKKSTGKDAAITLDKAKITVNKNMIPFDPEKPFIASGIRIGTPAVTTRGMKENEMVRIARWIERAVVNKENELALKEIAAEVVELTAKFPLPEFI